MISQTLFRQHAIEIINQVQQAYWDLAFAIRNEQITREAMKLAETQLNNNQRQVEVGTLAPIDVISTATVLESRRQDVFQAINAVAQAENALKMMVVEGPDADLWKARLEPVDSFDVQPVMVPLEDAIRLAFANRPEVRQYGIQKEMNKVSKALDYAVNYILKAIVLNSLPSWMLGLGGTPAVAFTCPPNSTQVPNAAQLACVDEGGNLVQPVQGPTPVFPGFVGGYGTSLARLFSQDYRTWTVGVNFSFPIRNRTAQANLGRRARPAGSSMFRLASSSSRLKSRSAMPCSQWLRRRIGLMQHVRQRSTPRISLRVSRRSFRRASQQPS